MYVVVSKEDENQWLCYDGLNEEYYFKKAFDYRAIRVKNIEDVYIEDIPKVLNVKIMKLTLVDIDK